MQYRELIIVPWRIIYRVAENKIYVLSVLDSRQNVEDILLKRLTGLKL
jgi:toxin ParE1/3/4